MMRLNANGGGEWRPVLGWSGLAAAVPMMLGGVMSASGQCPAGPVPGVGLPGYGGSIRAMLVLPNGDAIVGGAFRTDQGAPGNSIARYNPDSRTWVGLGGGVNRSSVVLALTTLPGGDIIAAGTFVAAGGVPAGRIARFSQTTGTWSSMGTVPTDNSFYILALATLADGDVVAGGLFSSIGGVAANNIARYSVSTGTWSPMGDGTNRVVTALTVIPGGDVVAGGSFSTAGGVGVKGVARYHPGTGEWSALNNGLGGDIFALAALATLPSGDVVATGKIYLTGPDSVELNIARYSMTTERWEPMSSTYPLGTGNILSLAVLPSGELIAGGDALVSAIGAPASSSGVLRYDRATDTWIPLVYASQTAGSAGIAQVTALAISATGNVFVGGKFERLGRVNSSRFGLYAFGDAPPQFRVEPYFRISECPERTVSFEIFPAPSESATYQWQRERVPIDPAVNPSAATATLVLTNLGPDDAGRYSCIITDRCDTYESNYGTLQVPVCPCTVADLAGGGENGLEADGTLDGADFVAFMNSFGIGDALIDPLADIAGDGADGLSRDGVVDGTDFVAFIHLFAAGC